MLNDPCAPLRAHLEAIQAELEKRQQSPPDKGGSILTPAEVASELATVSDQQLQQQLQQVQEQLRRCLAQQN
jgi:hypothetical protein